MNKPKQKKCQECKNLFSSYLKAYFQGRIVCQKCYYHLNWNLKSRHINNRKSEELLMLKQINQSQAYKTLNKAILKVR